MIKLNKKTLKFFDTTTKIFIWLITIASIVWITWAFVLATMGQEQIAESLATEICRTLLGGVGMYVITSSVSNIFKYNNGSIFGTSQTYNTDMNNKGE